MRIRVATLNAWALPEPFSLDLAPRLEAVAKELPRLGLDIAVFQEVWTDWARARLLRAGRDAGLVHTWSPPITLGGGGLLLASRLPMQHLHFEPYALRGDPGQLENGEFVSGKGLLHVRVATPRGTISVFDTHLHARYARKAQHEYRATRVGQIVQLAHRLEQSTEPTIVLGDFNFTEADPGYAVMRGLTHLRDTAVLLDSRFATAAGTNPYRRGDRRPDRRVDYVFIRDGWGGRLRAQGLEPVFDAPLRVGGRALACSNHRGVLAELQLDARRGGSPPGPPDPSAVALADRYLAKGRRRARLRRSSERSLASAGLGFALAAAAAAQRRSTSRRGFLRGALRGAAIAVLVPSFGLGLAFELVRQDEIGEFEKASRQLASLGRGIPAPV